MLCHTFADQKHPNGVVMMALRNSMNRSSNRTGLHETKETGRDLDVLRQRTGPDADPASSWGWPSVSE